MASAVEALSDSESVELCPVRPEELAFRKNLPRELFEKRPHLFLARLLIVAAILAGCLVLFYLVDHVAAKCVVIVVLGVMFAHLVELQHELLHGHVFHSRGLHAVMGTLVGLPMFSSYAGYQAGHLRHHRDLGTPENREFFDYRHERLNSIAGFLYSAFSMHRYVKVLSEMARALIGRKSADAVNEREARAIRRDYLVMLAVLACTVGLSIYFARIDLLYLWLLPLPFAEAMHFLIETPEHYGLNTQTMSDPLANTRSVPGTSWFLAWLTNGNHLHNAHHFHHGIPMCNIRKLHELIVPRIQDKCIEQGYFTFYRKVVRGEFTHVKEESCMTR